MSTEYPSKIDNIQNGEAVNAGVTNRPIDQLAQRTQSLLEKVDNGLFGSANFAYDAPIENDALPGMAVYLDDTGIWRKGYATTEIDASGVETGVARSAFISGVVQNRHSSVLADIVLCGKFTISAADLLAVMVDGVITTGQIFLSGTPGKKGFLTAYQPPIGVYVGVVAGPDASNNYTFLVNPSPRKVLEDHVHIRVDLAMVHVTDYRVPGWITINAGAISSSSSTTLHSSSSSGNIIKSGDPGVIMFEGKNIPAGAVYGYNIEADPVLSKFWPPLPLSGVYLERNGTGMRIVGAAGQQTVIVNEDGVWFMSGCATETPFGQSAINPGSGCITFPDQITLWMTRVKYRTNGGVVTSLQAADSTIEITDLHGNEATTGALQIKAKIPIAQTDGTAGYEAVKSVAADGVTLQRGVVTEGIKSNSPYIELTGTAVDEASGDPGSGYVGGRVILNFTNPTAPWEGSPQVIALDNVYINSTLGVHALVFRKGLSTSLRAGFRIPTQDVPSSGLLLHLEALVNAYGSGTFPDLTVTFRRVPQPSAELSILTIPSPDSAFDALHLSAVGAVVANNYAYVKSSNTVVYPGDLIFFTLSRSNSDGYNADIGLLDLRWKLSQTSSSSSPHP